MAGGLLTLEHMTATLDLNLPSLAYELGAWVVSIPVFRGRVQRFRCASLAHAQRFLELFLRAVAQRPKSLKAGWPYNR